jgi:lipopolysaccharide transport system ATP-binding protein
MGDLAIRAEGLGKSYRINRSRASRPYRTVQEELLALPRRLFGGGSERRETVWALRDVSFDVEHGEVVGVIGRNGAGKSTLLKVLSRVTDPTTGGADVYGRVGSLLEVGTGFHPELTGRENIFLNGAILGMTRREIRRNFDSIVSFAEVERFLDTPVKRYSSGMYVRLAFAVAAHLEPDILVIDEVLAVGDAEFQKKSLGKMHDVSRGGRTVLFVSHNMAAIQALCTRTIWLDRGLVAAEGATPAVITRYLQGARPVDDGGSRRRLGTSIELRRISITPNPVSSGGAVELSITLGATDPVKLGEVAVLFYSSLETRIAVIDLRMAHLPARLDADTPWTATATIASLNLVEGDYRIGLFVSSSDFVGDVLDLAELTVHAREHAAIAPYDAAHRGVVELDVRIHA